MIDKFHNSVSILSPRILINKHLFWQIQTHLYVPSIAPLKSETGNNESPEYKLFQLVHHKYHRTFFLTQYVLDFFF